ncbi:hypothetical protein LOK49_LG05G01952 [Camellia lanceoleosa]|uniref:Uncharacterized protein n=1 Tax=Camellia lanceoleosa TaxID=1840588 RepID=A0ACC0HL44_9ERIC|nr:hypothetical protein LOK49_LG05G01952 [Camellia lanceoleosa]
MDNTTDMDTEIAREDIGEQQLPALGLPPSKSFKEALATTRNCSYAFDSRVEILSSDEENDDVQEGHSKIQGIYPEHRGLPTISLPKKLLAKIRKPWENALILASMRSEEVDRRRIRDIVKDLVTDSPIHYPSMDLLKLLSWNCRGADNNNFKRNFVEIIRAHKPEIIILMETKVTFSKMGNFFNRLGFTASSIVDPIGRVRGIWIIWDTTQVNVRASSVSSQVIYATIHKEDYEEWVLAAIYASPNPVMRKHLWVKLEDMTENMDKPWLVVGDFNDYASQGEKRSFTSTQSSNRSQKFLERINNCNLINLGSSGPKMTWTNDRQGLANTIERLDRALSNPEWRTMFPEATVRVLLRTYSDHSPLVIYTQDIP